MSVRRIGATIRLEGDCPVEDAEVLVRALQGAPGATIDWTEADRLHTAVVQLVLMAKREIRGPCGDPFVARWIEPDMVAASTT